MKWESVRYALSLESVFKSFSQTKSNWLEFASQTDVIAFQLCPAERTGK